MLYEDLIYLWLSFIIYEFIPITTFKISLSLLFFIFIIKEIFFISFVIGIRKKILQVYFNIGPILEKFLIGLIFIFYIIDLSFLNLKVYLEKVYFSSFIAILWFLHYIFIIKFFFFKFTFNYLKILLGIIFPILMLVIIQDIFNILDLSFQGDIFLFLFLIILFSPFLMIKIWPVKPLDDIELKYTILEFLEKNKVKINQIYVLGDLGKKLYTAGIIGFLPPFKYLFFSKPLLDILSPEEILGVVAHEIGHLKKKHNLWLLLLLFNLPLFLLTTLILIFLIIYFFYPDFIQIIKNKETLPFEVELVLGIMLIFFSFIYIRYIFAFFLRQFEREADLYSVFILKSSQPIISALFKIGEITGQLYKKRWHHYGIFERIEFLNKILFDIESFNKIKRRFTKIRLILIFWIILNLMIILGSLYFQEILEKLICLFSCYI